MRSWCLLGALIGIAVVTKARVDLFSEERQLKKELRRG